MNRDRLRRIRNWQSSEWYAALVVRPLAILVMLVIADWRFVTPNLLTFLATVAKLLAALAILADEPAGLWAAAILLQVGLLFDHLDGTLARYRRAFTDFGSFFDKVSDAFTWFVILMAAGWVEARHGAGPLALILAATGAYWLLTLGHMKWLAETLRPRPSSGPPPEHQPPERSAREWLRWFFVKLAQIPRFEEVDQFFWLGLALVTGKVMWFLWAAAVTQPFVAGYMFVKRGRALARSSACP